MGGGSRLDKASAASVFLSLIDREWLICYVRGCKNSGCWGHKVIVLQES